MVPRTKGELIEHYCQREPKVFIQYDGFNVGRDSCDCVMRPDEDGHCIMSGISRELMLGADVRVLIPPETDSAVAVRMLRKIAKWIKRDGFSCASQLREMMAAEANAKPDWENIPF